VRKVTLTLFGVTTVLLAVLMSGCGGGGASFGISVSLATTPAPTVDQGQVVNVKATIVNDSSNKGVTWSLSGIGSLSSQTTTSVTYVAPSSVTTATKATVTATSVANTNATASISIEINPPPSITTTSLASGTAGTCYGQVSTSTGATCNGETLTETGGTSPFTWGVVSGQIPPGLSLSSSSGAITGTPTTPGTYTATFQLSDSVGLSSTATLSITIADPPALTVTTGSLPTGASNLSYSYTLSASGGVAPYNWKISSGTLPAGLSLSPSGVISGTPTATGTSSFTVMVTDSAGPTPGTATKALSITVNQKLFSIATTSLPGGTVGIGYSTTLQYGGGVPPVTWTVVSGALPSWAALNSSTGVISGTPNAAGAASFTVQAADSESPTPDVATQALSISISSTTRNAFLSGQYAFSLAGYDGGMVGSFTADGQGHITTGTEDLEDAATGMSGANGGNIAITGGTYTIGFDNRGVLSYTDASGHTFTFDLALSAVGSASTGASAQGAMIETDASGDNFTGSFALQNPSAFNTTVLAGGYAFGFSGWDSTANPDVVVGSASIAGGALSNGLLDENDGGTVSSAVSFTGSLNISSSGRGTISSSTAQANFTFYVVSKTEWFAIAYDRTTGAVRTGLVEQQSGSPYTNSSLSGTMVLESQSETSAPALQAEVGLFTSTGNSTANTSLDVDEGGTLGAQTDTDALNFTASSNGRFTATPQNSSAFVGYIIAPNQAFIAGTGSAPSFGTIEPQSAGPFSASSLDGSFFVGSLPLVTAPPGSQPPTVSSGEISFDGAVNYTGTIDSSHAGTVTTTQLTDTYSVDSSSGRVSVSPAGAIIYIVSSSQLVILSTGQAGSTNPLIEIAQR
jgi:hypothetical protein